MCALRTHLIFCPERFARRGQFAPTRDLLGLMRHHISIVIVNFRTPKLVVGCLESLLGELNELDARVVIVDNNSGDDSIGRIAAWLAENDSGGKALLIEARHNGGFAAGNNLGIRRLEAEHYLLLNSDTIVRPGAIRLMLETAASFPEAGLVSPRLDWPSGEGQESCFRFHHPLSELIDAAQTGVIDKCLPGYVVPLPVQAASVSPDWTSFACVLIRGEVFRQIGLLDEGYFMYFEDVEFCHRARRAGWSIVHNPAARVVHLRGGSSSVKRQARLKKRIPRYFYESRTRFFFQTYGRLGLTAANLLWWAGRIVSRTRQTLGRPDKSSVERQWLDIWTNWLRPMKPRDSSANPQPSAL